MTSRRLMWAALFSILAVTLVIGSRGPGEPPTQAERVEHLTSQVRCPTCRSQSVADSDAPAAVAIREEVERRVGEGQSDSAILGFLVDRFTEDVRLNPEPKGVGILVWALPVAALAVVTGALAWLFVSRARRGRALQPSDDDRRLVEEALRR